MAKPDSGHIVIPVTAQVLMGAEALSGEIIRDIELARMPLSIIELKAIRLARLLNNSQVQPTFQRERSGDTSTKSTGELENAV